MSLVVSELYKKYGNKVVVDHLRFEMKERSVRSSGNQWSGKNHLHPHDAGNAVKGRGRNPVEREASGYGNLQRRVSGGGERPVSQVFLMDQLLYFASLRGVAEKRGEKEDQILGKTAGGGRISVSRPDRPGESTALMGTKKSFSLSGGRKKRQKPKLADQLSKGNQQKIQFMTALLSDPELLILDEPLSGLDPVNTDLFRDVIREQIAKGKYLIMSSHQMATVEEFCTDITILDRSKRWCREI